jgi:hypothetical protein
MSVKTIPHHISIVQVTITKISYGHNIICGLPIKTFAQPSKHCMARNVHAYVVTVLVCPLCRYGVSVECPSSSQRVHDLFHCLCGCCFVQISEWIHGKKRSTT